MATEAFSDRHLTAGMDPDGSNWQIPSARTLSSGQPSAGPQPLVSIWDRFNEANLDRVEVLEQAAVAVLGGDLEPGLRQRAKRAAGRLAELVGTFGFGCGARLAREIEEILRGRAPLTQSHILRLSELVVALRSELDRPPDEMYPYGEAPSADRPSLLIVESDRDVGERLALEATTRGMRAEAVLNAPAARGAVARLRPDVVILDLALADALDAGPTLMKELSTMVPPVPVLVLTERDTLQDRVQVASLGGYAFLRKPLPPVEVLDAVTEMLNQLRASRGSVLVVDDDPQVLAAARSVLEAQGLKVTTRDDPRQFYDALERSSPDLLLLDTDMPHFSGVDLCRVVRSDPGWRTLPVLFLVAGDDVDSRDRAFAVRADDYVCKPIEGPELVAQVLNRLERTQLHRSLADTDTLTGVANRRKAGHLLSQSLRLAARYDESLGLAIMHLDNFGAINERYGRASADAVLHRFAELLTEAFRDEDIVARWGGGEFVVGMYGMMRRAGTDRVAKVLDGLRAERFVGPGGVSFGATCSGAVVQYPEDGKDWQALYRAADEVLHHVKEAGGNRVVAKGWTPDEDQPPEVRKLDVVVVDNDEVLAGLVLHALQTRGYSAEWLKDGQLAAAHLVAGSLQARVVLLDVDLPGLDGYDVLQRLTAEIAAHRNSDGTVRRRTRVIVFTNRSTEHHVLKALELGAFDHVAKPFSLPVLVHRIRRAMEA